MDGTSEDWFLGVHISMSERSFLSSRKQCIPIEEMDVLGEHFPGL